MQIFIWIFIFLFYFLCIYNIIRISREEFLDPGKKAANPFSQPPQGPQLQRDEVDDPPSKPPEGDNPTDYPTSKTEGEEAAPPKDDGIKDVVPEETDPIKPNCECFDSQTEIYLDSNSVLWKKLKKDIKIIKKKITEANTRVGKNMDLIQLNDQYCRASCCAVESMEGFGEKRSSTCAGMGFKCTNTARLP